MKIIVVRHGEAEWNTLGKQMGQLDSPLTPRGREQAQAIAERIGPMRPDILYSSDLGRAMETAQFIADTCQLRITPHKGLRERNMGVFQGLTVEETRQTFPQEVAELESIGDSYVIPDGESALQRRERSLRTMNELVAASDADTIIVVTHGGILMGFFESVLGLSPGSGDRFERINAAYNAFTFEDNHWVLETWGDISHLKDTTSLDESARWARSNRS